MTTRFAEWIRRLALGAIFVLGATQAATAAPIVNFTSSTTTETGHFGTTTQASGTGFFFVTGDTAAETFSGNGVLSTSSSTWTIPISFNNLNSGGFVDLNALINGTLVGAFVVSQADGTGNLTGTFSYAPIAAVVGTFTLSLVETNNVPGGAGSIQFGSTGSVDLVAAAAGAPELDGTGLGAGLAMGACLLMLMDGRRRFVQG